MFMPPFDPLPSDLRSAIRDRDLKRASALLLSVQEPPIRHLSDDDKAALADFMARCSDHDPMWLRGAKSRIIRLKIPPLSTCAHILLAEGLVSFQRARVSTHYEKAAEYFQNVLNLPISIYDGGEERAYAQYSLARCSYKLGRYDAALQQIEELRRSERSPRELGSALVNMLEGWIQFRLNDVARAAKLFKSAQSLFNKYRSWINLGNTLSALGRIERRQNLKASEQYLRDALTAFRRDRSTIEHRYMGRAYRNLARTLRLLALEGDNPESRREETLTLLEKAAGIYRRRGNHHERADVFNIRAGVLLDQGDRQSLNLAVDSIHEGYKLVKQSQDAVLVENRILRALKTLKSPDTDEPVTARDILDEIEPLASKLKDMGNTRLWARLRTAQARILLGIPWCDAAGAQKLADEALKTIGNNRSDYLVREILALSTEIGESRQTGVFGTNAMRVQEIGLESAINELETSIWWYFLKRNRNSETKTRAALRIGFPRQKRIEAGRKRYSSGPERRP
jgi:tetratricopeptide (TPR) repeat protein